MPRFLASGYGLSQSLWFLDKRIAGSGNEIAAGPGGKQSRSQSMPVRGLVVGMALAVGVRSYSVNVRTVTSKFLRPEALCQKCKLTRVTGRLLSVGFKFKDFKQQAR